MSGPRPRYLEGKYRPEDFIVPGQDNNGNSMRVWARVVPLLDRAIDILFGSRRFPFRSKGDLIRWCVKFGVDHLNTLEPCTGSVLIRAEAMMSILRDEELNHAFLTVFQAMQLTVGMHVQAQALGEARRVVSLMYDQIGLMEDGYWKSRYLDEIATKFGYLLNGSAPGAILGDSVSYGGVDED